MFITFRTELLFLLFGTAGFCLPPREHRTRIAQLLKCCYGAGGDEPSGSSLLEA